MMKALSSAVAAIVSCALAVATGVAQDSARCPAEFAWPPVTDETRPWAYWWWPASAVDREGLTWNLETCRKAGYGGLHAIPIYGVKGRESQSIEYLSPKWMEMLAHATAEAKRLGMAVDMTTGTGWCFGGPTVSQDDACANLDLTVHPVEAGAVSQKPAGRRVKRAAPGGEGLMLNAFSVGAMERYLERFDKAFAQYKGVLPRAMYHDSYEYAGNWAGELLREFETRRGYRLESHLSALAGKAPADEVARVRTDYNETLSDMHRAYIERWVAWAHRLGCQTRDQAHGSPSNLLDTYAACDIPETEMFRNDQDILFSKFASSAAHVAGKRLVGAETGTWMAEHFTETLAEMKALVDRLFVSGVNHVIYHGTCYSPPDAPWPGWLFYASTEMNSRNALWRDVPALNAYVARCQSILQAGGPDGDVLLYWPLHDLWHQRAEMKIDFGVHTPWYRGTAFRAVAEKLWQRGWQFDYVSDRQLRDARVEGRTIVVPGGKYRAVVVPECAMMPEKTVEALVALARGGATVIFEKHIPRDVPGLGNLDERRAKLRTVLDGVVSIHGDCPDFRGHGDCPDFLGESRENGTVPVGRRGNGRVLVADDVGAALAAAGVPRESIVDQPGVAFIRRRHDAGCHYFIANHGPSPVDAWAPLGRTCKSAVLMDPLDGKCGTAAVRQNANGASEVLLQLQPGESIVLRTFADRTVEGPAWTYLRAAGDPTEVAGAWRVEFLEGGPEIPAGFETARLASWTELGGEEARRFAGTARYTIALDAPPQAAPAWLLDLGRVCETARVRLNGQELGAVFAPPWHVRLPQLKPKGNLLQIEVTSTSANRIRDLDRRGVAWKVFHDINFVNIDYRPFDASGWPLRPCGLLGPVRLTPVAPFTHPGHPACQSSSDK